MDRSATDEKRANAAGKAAGPRKRHVPMRTCVACGSKLPKRDLTRIVAARDGSVIVDHGGKMAGRGAYVCQNGRCLRGDIKRGRLENALRVKVTEDGVARIVADVRGNQG